MWILFSLVNQFLLSTYIRLSYVRPLVCAGPVSLSGGLSLIRTTSLPVRNVSVGFAPRSDVPQFAHPGVVLFIVGILRFLKVR